MDFGSGCHGGEEILPDALPGILAELFVTQSHVDSGLKSGVDISRAACC